MRRDLLNDDVVDALNSILFNIEGLFNAMKRMESADACLLSDLGMIGLSLVKNAQDGIGNFCEVLTRAVGDIGVLRQDCNYNNLSAVEGVEIEFSDIMKKISEVEEFPLCVEIVKAFRPGCNDNVFEVNKVPSSQEEREGLKKSDHEDPVDNSKVAQG